MSDINLFEVATRANYQFPFRGMINVIDLWDLSLTNLDSVFKALNAEAKKHEEESLLNAKSKEDEASPCSDPAFRSSFMFAPNHRPIRPASV